MISRLLCLLTTSALVFSSGASFSAGPSTDLPPQQVLMAEIPSALTEEEIPADIPGQQIPPVAFREDVLATGGSQTSYTTEKLAENVYAAVATPGGEATSNGFFVVGPEYVVAGGAHMTAGAIGDLHKAIAAITSKPVRYFILPHHHKGYSYTDFDFPPGCDVIMSWQGWQAVDKEMRDFERTALFFSDGMTLKLGGMTIIVTNIGKAHTDGDAIVFIPEAGVLFTSDLVFTQSVGYMGEGFIQDWVMAIEFLERLGAKKVIPGYGPVSAVAEVSRFKAFFKAFVTEVLMHIERGESLEQTKHSFALPKYENLDGYDQFIQFNIERAYSQLKESFSR